MMALFRGGPMDGKRKELNAVVSFIAIPTLPVDRSGRFARLIYRQAETIGEVVVYELDDERRQ